VLFIDDLEHLTISFLRLVFLISQMLSSNRFMLVCSLEAENIEKILLPIVSSSEMGYKSFDVGTFYESEVSNLLKAEKIRSDKLLALVISLYNSNIKKIKYIIHNYRLLEDLLNRKNFEVKFSELIAFVYDSLGDDHKNMLCRLSAYEDIIPCQVFDDYENLIDDLLSVKFLKKSATGDMAYISFYLADIREYVKLRNKDKKPEISEFKNIEGFEGFLIEHYKMMFLLQSPDPEISQKRITCLLDRYIRNNLYLLAIKLINNAARIALSQKNYQIVFHMLKRLSICLSNAVFDEKYRSMLEDFIKWKTPSSLRAYFIYIYAQLLFMSGNVKESFEYILDVIDMLKSSAIDTESCELLLDAYGTAITRIPGFDSSSFINEFNKSGILSGNLALKTKYLSKLSNVYFKMGKYDRSKKILKDILGNLNKIDDKWLAGDIYNNLGRLAAFTNKDEQTIVGYYRKSAEIYREIGDLKGEHKPLNNLGIYFSGSMGLSTGYYYLSLCVEISKFNNDYDSIALLANNIVTIFYQYGDWDKALEYLTRSIAYSSKIYNKKLYTIAISNFIIINIFRGNLIIARQYSHIYKSEIADIAEKDKLLNYYKTMADLEFYDNRFQKSCGFLKTCFTLSRKYNFPKQAFDSALQLYENYMLYNRNAQKIASYIDYVNNTIPEDPSDLIYIKKVQAMDRSLEGNYVQAIDLIEDSVSSLQTISGSKIESAILYMTAAVIYMRAHTEKSEMLIYKKISQYYLDISLKIFADLDALNLYLIYVKMPFCSVLKEQTASSFKTEIFMRDKRQFEKIINNLSNRINILENVSLKENLPNRKSLSENLIELLKDSLYTINFTFKGIMNKVENRISGLSRSSQSLIELLSISKKINSMLDTKGLFEIILESIINILQAERSFIFLSDNKKLNLEAVYSINKAELSCSPDKNVIEMAEKSFAENKFFSGFSEIENAEFCNLSDKRRFYLSIPLNIEQKTIGCLYIDLPHNMAKIEKTHMELAQLFAEYASTAIDKAHNIEELRRAMENLKTLDRLKSEFITIASHELRTPLVTIKGYLELLLNGLLGKLNDRQFKGLTLSNNNLERLIKIVDDIIIIAEIERGEESLFKEIFDINTLIPSLRAEIDPYINKRHQELEIVLCPEPLQIYGDRDKIKAALLNILMNAIRFTKDNGKIGVKTELIDNKILVTVSDNGIGIPEDEIPKIFDKFYEIQKSSYHKSGTYEFLSGGAGLGLPIARAIVELHFGYIKVESEINRGSRFMIYFPRMENLDIDRNK